MSKNQTENPVIGLDRTAWRAMGVGRAQGRDLYDHLHSLPYEELLMVNPVLNTA